MALTKAFRLCFLIAFQIIILLQNIQANDRAGLQSIPDPAGTEILCLLRDNTGFLWLGTAHGLKRYDGRSIRPHGDSKEPITAMAFSPTGELWVTTADQPAYLNPTLAGPPEQLHLKAAYSGYTSLLFDRAGRFWLGTERGLVQLRLDNEHKILEENYFQTGTGGISHQHVTTLLEDNSGTIWVGTAGGGLDRFLAGTGTFVAYRHSTADQSTIAGDHITALTQDQNDNIWVGTAASGLCRFHPRKGTFDRFDTAPHIVDLATTPDGRVWTVAKTGAPAWFDERTSAFIPLGSESDWKPVNDLYVGAAGELWMAGRELHLYTDPKAEPSGTSAPVFLEAERLTSSGSEPLAPDNGILSWEDESTVARIHFAMPEFSFRNTHRYRYRLVGLHPDWLILGNEGRVTLTGLEPGAYTLEIQGALDGETWGPTTRMPVAVEGFVFPEGLTWLLPGLLILGWALQLHRQNRRLKENQADTERLRTDNEQLRITDQERDRLLANTTHELRTPLNGIVGIAEALKNGSLGDITEKQEHNLNLIISSGSRLAATVNDILDFARLHESTIELELEAVDLHQLAGNILELQRPLLHGKPVDLTNDVPGTDMLVRADENRLAQILHNLVGNAVKFTHEGVIVIGAEKEGDKITVWVRDTGEGIPEVDCKRIFERFSQAENRARHSGLGLGLAITRELVRLHGGVIQVDSEEGKGSEFRFSLAAADGSEHVAAQPSARPVSTVSRSKPPAPDSPSTGLFEILVVDDEPINLQVLSNFLEPDNHKLTLATHGKDALELIAKQRFDLVLLDIMMPNMSGFEVCRRIREEYMPEELPIVMLTARYQLSDVVQGFEVGANDYLVKPVSRDELLVRMKTHLRLLQTTRRLKSTQLRLNEVNKLLEQQVRDRTLEIRERNDELEALDDIVRTINNEIELSNLLSSLLQEAMTLFPQSDKGIFLVREPDRDLFHMAAVAGYDEEKAYETWLSPDRIHNWFAIPPDAGMDEVRILSDFSKADRGDLKEFFPMPNCSLLMPVHLHDRIEGFLLLDNSDNPCAFGGSDINRLDRLKAHAVSAVAKARLLEDMRGKNQELVRRQRKLIMQEKMAYLTTLTAGIAHEIQNPLNFVNNFAAVAVEMARELHDTLHKSRKKMLGNTYAEVKEILDDLEENAGMIYQYGKRADRIVRSMMVHSQEGPQERRPMDLNQMMDEQYELVYHAIHAFGHRVDIEVTRDYDPGAQSIDAVPQDIGRALLNLINNALYAMGEKKETLGEDYRPQLFMSTRKHEDHIEIRIRDNGTGISEANHDRIFTPFFTTKPTGKGIGLGLSICYHIVVEGHGGEIKVDSKEGEYAEFRLTLPTRRSSDSSP
ncbi:MAG: ATP-binding protein [Acidobacteriota bacterium]|nr:ATP-binding protein [Acidobacteriota bacterium]